MAPDKTDEELDLEEELETDPITSDEDNEEPGSSSGPDTTDWQRAYKGQQKVTQKKQNQIDKLQEQVDRLTELLEEEKSNKSASDTKVKDLESQLAGVSDKLKEVAAEKGSLDNKLARQSLILKEHPKLAPFMRYIPEGDDLESFQKNAEDFAATLESFQVQTVEEDLEGATPPPPGGDESLSSAKIDRLWDKAVSLAGVPGKQEEYEEAYNAWLKAWDAQNKTN